MDVERVLESCYNSPEVSPVNRLQVPGAAANVPLTPSGSERETDDEHYLEVACTALLTCRNQHVP